MGKPWVWESAAYWLLYVVALAAVLWHWAHDNPVLAGLCLVGVVVSMRLITRSPRRKDPVGPPGP
ncbi:hypothetical protein [Thermobifida cellulosilytica]|uniref:Uncharacterized protein n=1 Tax=Thermobifida cellulosilytica TB100 TaxID=665004 RepID=A0A147KN10_THECS|nr:hypothetical protein [Thermobifida cellulosilytica]KUP98663.1 hypothetical protein AC529_00285 [Thermobifida cellulosilytica TB100]